MKESWEASSKYEDFMGRWSRRVADRFVDWLAIPHGLRWLDVGCGSGALSEAILSRSKPSALTAVDQSEGFIKGVSERLGDAAQCKVGDATAMPVEDDSVDITVSGLVLNFIPEPLQALAEMKRVTAKHGVVAAYVWDYSGTMEFLNLFWDAAVELTGDASALHEAYRFPNATPDALRELFHSTGYTNIETAPIEIETVFQSFEDYWNPFLGGQGPAPTFVMSLDEQTRQKLRTIIHSRLPINADGSIPLTARAWAIRGKTA